mmetsp:Transcript_27064/g.65099  ORF Transcript_27064/g.65099 Transcript_27064/m.65099 type:complete len:265 (-) Transcript_27064:556-1350(-)
MDNCILDICMIRISPPNFLHDVGMLNENRIYLLHHRGRVRVARVHIMPDRLCRQRDAPVRQQNSIALISHIQDVHGKLRASVSEPVRSSLHLHQHVNRFLQFLSELGTNLQQLGIPLDCVRPVSLPLSVTNPLTLYHIHAPATQFPDSLQMISQRRLVSNFHTRPCGKQVAQKRSEQVSMPFVDSLLRQKFCVAHHRRQPHDRGGSRTLLSVLLRPDGHHIPGNDVQQKEQCCAIFQPLAKILNLLGVNVRQFQIHPPEQKLLN